MQLAATPIAARIPSVDGYNPLIPDYGDARIAAAPYERGATFPTLDAAIAAARHESDEMDTAAAVFQAGEGAFRIGLATHVTSDGPEPLIFGADIARRIQFDDPSLVALAWLDAVAVRR